MKRNRKKLQSKSKQQNKGVSGVPAHDMMIDSGMELTIPFYNVNGKVWIPSTPWEAGEYEGTEWAKTASPTSLRIAAERLTTNEQIDQHVSWCKQCESNGQPYNGDLRITPPSEFDSDAEVREFYRNLVMSFPCYRGNDPDIKVGKFVVTGVLGHNLRSFDDGWAAAVRKHWNKVKMAEQP